MLYNFNETQTMETSMHWCFKSKKILNFLPGTYEGGYELMKELMNFQGGFVS